MPTAAIWGTGSIAATHVQALRINGINIAAVVGRTLEGTRAFAAKWDIPRYSVDPDVLFEKSIDCVHICTPPALHYEMIMQLLQRNKNVLCEKPLCLDNGQAQRLAKLAQEKGLVCAVDFNVRFHAACQEARALVHRPDFGRVLLIHGCYLQEFGCLPTRLDWRFDPALAGSMHAVTEIGSHWMDLAQYISGKRIIAVSARFGCFHPDAYLENGIIHADSTPEREHFKITSEDAAVVSFCLENGAIGAVTLSEISQGRSNFLSLEITGEKKNLWWNSEDQDRLYFAERGEAIHSMIFPFENGFTGTFQKLVAAVYQHIGANGGYTVAAYPDFQDGMRNVLLCNAIWESARCGSSWVRIS